MINFLRKYIHDHRRLKRCFYIIRRDVFDVLMNTCGDNQARLLVERFGFGNDKKLWDQGITDTYRIHRFALSPETPQVVHAFYDGDHIVVQGSRYSDDKAEPHLTTQIQFWGQVKGVLTPISDHYANKENWYFGVNLNEATTLDQLDVIDHSTENQNIDKVRIRYRNRSLMWSEWSTLVDIDG